MTNSLPRNALYVAVVTEPKRVIGRRIYPPVTHPEIYDTDINNVLAEISGGYEHRMHALICVDLDTGDVQKLDWQRELDGWRAEHMSVSEQRALMPRR